MPLPMLPDAPAGLHPRMHDETAMDESREFARLYAIGAIENRNPPTAPEVAAIRDANEALFRRLKALSRGRGK